MSRENTATLNYQLTSYAQGHMNDVSRTYELAERLVPTVPVAGTTGQYKVFNDENSFQIYQTARALGGDPTRIEFSATDDFFNCKPHALEVAVDSEERRQVGNNPAGLQMLVEAKIKAVVNAAALSCAKRRVDFVMNALTPVAERGNWSNPDIDPIDQIDEQIDELSKLLGSTEMIKITMSLTSWRTLRNHPKSKARCNGVQAIPLSRQQVTDALALPVEIGVFAISYHNEKLGQSNKTKSRLLQSDVILHASMPSPTQYDPSPFKCFVAGPNNIASVRTWQAPNGLYEGHYVDWSENMKQTSTLSARRLQIT